MAVDLKRGGMSWKTLLLEIGYGRRERLQVLSGVRLVWLSAQVQGLRRFTTWGKRKVLVAVQRGKV